MIIRVKWDVSRTHGVENLTIEDIGYSEKEWQELTDDEKECEIAKALDSLPEQPYMQLSSYEEY